VPDDPVPGLDTGGMKWRQSFDTRLIARVGIVAAVYVAGTLALAPISYGPLQFRVSEMLKALALVHPSYAAAFGLGTLISNLTSPFGVFDWALMPVVDVAAALLCYRMRRWPVLALVVQALLIAAGVAAFPLGMGGGFPLLPSFLSVGASQVVLLLAGYGLVRAVQRAYPAGLA